jgi:hypothetical protein
MPEDKPLKSAYELAMERLRAKDREEGIDDGPPLTPAQKERIAEIRRDADAKLAELEILHRKNLSETRGDPEAIAKLEENYKTDRARVASRRDDAIARVRREPGAAD